MGAIYDFFTKKIKFKAKNIFYKRVEFQDNKFAQRVWTRAGGRLTNAKFKAIKKKEIAKAKLLKSKGLKKEKLAFIRSKDFKYVLRNQILQNRKALIQQKVDVIIDKAQFDAVLNRRLKVTLEELTTLKGYEKLAKVARKGNLINIRQEIENLLQKDENIRDFLRQLGYKTFSNKNITDILSIADLDDSEFWDAVRRFKEDKEIAKLDEITQSPNWEGT